MATSGGQTLGVTISANMDPSGILGAVKQMQGAFNGLKLPANLTGDILKDFNKLQESLKKFDSIAKQDHFSKADLRSLEKLQKEIDSTFGNLKSSFNDLSGQKFYLDADYTKIKEARAAVDELKADIQSKLSEIKIDFSSAKGGTTSLGLDELIAGMERGVKSSKVLSAAMGEVKQSLKAGDFSSAANQLSQIITKSNDLKGAGTGLLNTFKQWGLIDFSTPANELVKTKKGAELLATALSKIVPEISKDNEAIQQLVQKLQEATKQKENLEKTGAENLVKEMSAGAQSAEQLGSAFKTVGQSSREMAQGVSQAAEQVKQLQQSTQYFFSLRNMINLLKRGIREAVDVVKELDAAMTETAVVTDYSVGDMWAKLPEYTANANALGATVKDMYEATTLYYQQGLKTEAAMGIANETMKMARIGGLEAADATDKMTAALRGFNMEINELSAQRVNDVYSNLAAKTASNTEELGTAMQRTASIAASAGMSFEGTAAFLAQAIETTREPAENLGTAMKTIVARFTELKKNPLEIVEVDGEEVSYNKVDTALQSIGVSLKDANGQFRALDEVFLDISKRWDSLTQTQQRYIATTAAGSRQQSRFIAMMSNYERTVELMDYANNSAGASNEQFAKTMESLEAKLNKLKNAWNEFLMGIMNDSWTKGIVDASTKVLDVVNKFIDALSFGGKAKGIKSALSLFTAFTGLKATGRIANRLIGGLGGLVDPTSSFKQGFRGGAIGQGRNQVQAKAITTPIVSSLARISGQIAAIAKRQGIKEAGQKGNAAGVKETSKEDYANTKRLFEQLGRKESFTLGEASNIFGKLDAKHQLSLFNNSPGTKAAMQQASMNWFGSKGLSKELTQQGKQYIASIYKGMEQGKIPVNKGIELIGQPQKWGQYFGTETANNISQSIRQQINKQEVTEGAWSKLGMKLAAPETRKGFLKDSENVKKYNAALKESLAEHIGGITAKGSVSNIGHLANSIGAVSDKFTQAGYGISAFGSLLAQLGGPIGVVGTGIQNLGGIVSSVGMSISAATGLFEIFTVGVKTAEGELLVAGSTIASIVAPLAAMGAALFIAYKHFKKIKEAGEEVTKTFEETNKSAEDNISKIKSYQGELAQLSKGVDSNGNNINLDDSQYQRYLEIVDDIAAINPDIVEGYNAQGHAIINNNTALAETLKLQEQIKDKAYDTYTSEASLQKLINARNINKDYKNIQIQEYGVSMGYGHGNEGRNASGGIGKAVPLAGDVSSIADKLRLLGGTDALGKAIKVDNAMLQKYGIESLDALISGEEQAVKNFIKHRDQIQADLANSGFKLNEGILKGFEKLGEDSDAFNAAIQPVYDNLLTQVSQSPFYKSIADEFKGALNIGLKDLASQDLSASEMSKAANNMAARFANLTTGSGKYKDALDIVEKAQNDFAQSLEETQYHADVQPAIDDLTKLKEEALNEGTAYGNALAEYLENQIQRISNFTQEGGANLTEALNTATDEIAAAESALDNFNEATKKDFATAAEGMKSIFDKTTETYKDSYGTEYKKHAEGMGDATFWTGAEALLSAKELEKLTKGKNGYDAAEAVAKKIQGLEPMLREGQEGFDAFTDRVLQCRTELDKLDGVEYDENGLLTAIPDDQWHNVAEALGISDDLLTSMLNKGRQFADISFMNVDEARKALAASDYSIKGTSTTSGNKNLYVKEDTLRAELANAGYVRREQQDEQIEKLLAKGVKTIPPVDSKDLTANKLKEYADDWGIKTLPDLIQTLNDTGDFTKDEIKEYADKLDLLGDESRFDSLYSDIISAAENPELAKQTSELEHISAQLGILINNKSIDDAEKDHKAAKEELYGKTGGIIDSVADYFAHGQNKEGKALTAGEYEETKKSLIAVGEEYKQQAEEARIKAAQATGDEKARWEALAKGYDQDYKNIQTYLDLGAKAFEQNQKDLEKQVEANKSKDSWRKEQGDESRLKKAVEDYYDKHGFGNAGSVKRPEINWGNEPYKQGRKWDAASTYGLTEDDLRNKKSTYLAQGETFDTIDGGQIAISFTPVMENGEVIEAGTMHNYFEELINQATNQETGKIDIEKLIQLDQTGIDGFVDETGERIHNALIAPFSSSDYSNIDQMADAYGNLEHTIEAARIAKENYNGTPMGSTVATDTGTGSTSTNVTKFVAEGAEVVQDSIKNIDQTANEGATHKTEFISEGADAVMNIAEGISGASSQGGSVKVGADTSAVASGVSEAASVINQTVANIPVGVQDNATSVAQGIARGIDALKATINVSTSVTGQNVDIYVTKHITEAAKGLNNKIVHHTLPSLGSLAKGSKYGRLGPKGKGGLTLTGEKGFEIAWLPNENRSMILGAEGPQMVNLPSDAVVYTHEQSKDILKRKGIPAGSHADESANSSSYQKRYTNGSSSGNSSSNSSNTITKKVKDTGKKVEKAATDAAKAVKKVSVWWENIARMTEASQRRMDNNQREFEKYIKDMRATLKTTGESLTLGGGGGDDYIKSIGQTIGYYNSQLKKANQELTQLDTGKWQTGKKKGKKATSKKNKKKKKKTNQVAYEQGADNIVEISYEGKTKKGKKTTKTAYVNTAKYIKTDPNTGEYIVDQKALNSEKNSKKRKAIADAVNKEINDRISKRNAAEDAIRQAQEALEKFGEELYETFFAWEIELTKIWNITQQIEESEARIGRAKNYQSLLESQIANGTVTADENSSNKILSAFTAAIAEEKKNIDLNVKSLGLQKENVQNLLSLNDDKETLKAVQDKLIANANGSQKLNDTEVAGYEKYAAELEKSIDAQAAAWKYMTVKQYDDGTLDIDFNYDKFKEAQTNGEITGDLGRAIQDYVKELTEASKGLNSQYETITSKMVEMNESLKTLQDEWAGYADELWQVSEEQQRKEVDNLKKLSDSITNTLKNLLDDVKRKLDQRRKQEDNAKTEQDISRKQQRLAALQADTSGGHQVEIAQLQQEIADAQQNYQRSLEDQLLENLQQQADIAAQQREQQIALQEATIEAVNNAAQVNAWMNEPEKYKEQIYAAFCAANEYDKKPEALQAQLDQKFAELFIGLSTNKTKQEEVEKSLTAATDTLKVIEKASENAQQNPTNVANQTSNSVTGSTAAAVAAATPKATTPTTSTPAAQPAAKPAAQPAAKTYPYGKASETSGQIDKGDSGKKVKAIQWALKEMGYKGSNNKALAIDGSFGDNTKHAVKSFQKAMKITVDGVVGNQTRKKFKAKGYKTGGLATQTGPAWLDGTPSKPELVLNAKDTQNFVALKDVLAHVMNGTSDISNSYGDILYEININVDKIEKDYDMDKVVDRVKKEIVKTSGYRNVTQVRNLR